MKKKKAEDDILVQAWIPPDAFSKLKSYAEKQGGISLAACIRRLIMFHMPTDGLKN